METSRQPYIPPTDTARITAIRNLLHEFDWESDDRQYALEAIERIADPRWDGPE